MTSSSNAGRAALTSYPRSVFLRVWLAGAGIIVVTIAGASLLMQGGFFIASIFYAVLCGLGLVFICVRAGGDDGKGYMIVGLCGLMIGFTAFVVGQDEVVLFGSSANDVVAANASASGADFLHFRNARVLVDHVASVEVMGQSSGKESPHLLYYLRVAPIVDADWTEGQPAGALAVIGSPQLGHRTSEWREPLNGGVKLNGLHLAERAKAVLDLARYENVNVASNAVFLRWSADPEGEAASARRRIWSAYLIAVAFWTVAVLVNTAVNCVRRRGDSQG